MATLESCIPPLADRRHVAIVPPSSNRINAVGRGAWRNTRGRVSSSSGGVCCGVAQPQRLGPVAGRGARLRTRPWQLTGSGHRRAVVVALQPRRSGRVHRRRGAGLTVVLKRHWRCSHGAVGEHVVGRMLSGPSSGGDCVDAAAAEQRADSQIVGGGPAPLWAAARHRCGSSPGGHDVVAGGSLCRRRAAVVGWCCCRRDSRTCGPVAPRGQTQHWLRGICFGADAPTRELESSGGAGRLDCRAEVVAARMPRRVRVT